MPPELPGFWRFYLPKPREIVSIWWWVANFQNDLWSAVVLTGTVILAFVLWTETLDTLWRYLSAFAPWLPGAAAWLFVALVVFALLRLNYHRFVALEASVRADGDRRMVEALFEKQTQAAQWLMQRDTHISEVSADYEAANQSLKMQVATRDAEIRELRQRLAPFIELQPLKIQSAILDGLVVRVEIQNPNGRPVRDVQVRLVSIKSDRLEDPRLALPPPGFSFTRSSHEGAGLTYPVPTGLAVHVDIAAALPLASPGRLARLGRLLHFLTFSQEEPDTPIRPLFPQAIGKIQLELEAGFQSETIKPARAFVTISFDCDVDYLRAELHRSSRWPVVPS